MAYPKILAEASRLRRLADPKRYDNGSYQLIKLMGWRWWFSHGFEREKKVGPFYIDMANTRLKWAIEADGAAYHTDVVKELERENYLHNRGWFIQRFRWVDLVRRPDECRGDILETWDSRRPLTKAEAETLRKVMNGQLIKSGHVIPRDKE